MDTRRMSRVVLAAAFGIAFAVSSCGIFDSESRKLTADELAAIGDTLKFQFAPDGDKYDLWFRTSRKMGADSTDWLVVSTTKLNGKTITVAIDSVMKLPTTGETRGFATGGWLYTLTDADYRVIFTYKGAEDAYRVRIIGPTVELLGWEHDPQFTFPSGFAPASRVWRKAK